MNSEEKIQKYLKPFEESSSHIKYLAEKIVREKQKLDDINDALVNFNVKLINIDI